MSSQEKLHVWREAAIFKQKRKMDNMDVGKIISQSQKNY